MDTEVTTLSDDEIVDLRIEEEIRLGDADGDDTDGDTTDDTDGDGDADTDDL
jgi:hypothetical protein